MNQYYIEITDTFGGEANYSWIQRYKIKAKSKKGAMQKLSRSTGWNFRYEYDIPDESFTSRYKVKNNCVCCFISYLDESLNNYDVEVLP